MVGTAHSTIRVARAAPVLMLAAMKTSHATTFPGTTSLEYRRIERSIRFMDERFREQPSLEQVAKSAGVAPHHFARMFRRWAGISPKQFMQRLTLQAARSSLGRDESVLQAALDAGLSGPGRLHDLFVTLEAVTPGEYKVRGSGLTVRHGSAATPFGPATIAVTARGIGFVGFEMPGGDVPGWDEYRQSWRDATFVEDVPAVAAVAARIWGTRTACERASETLDPRLEFPDTGVAGAAARRTRFDSQLFRRCRRYRSAHVPRAQWAARWARIPSPG